MVNFCCCCCCCSRQTYTHSKVVQSEKSVICLNLSFDVDFCSEYYVCLKNVLCEKHSFGTVWLCWLFFFFFRFTFRVCVCFFFVVHGCLDLSQCITITCIVMTTTTTTSNKNDEKHQHQMESENFFEIRFFFAFFVFSSNEKSKLHRTTFFLLVTKEKKTQLGKAEIFPWKRLVL